MRCQQYSLRMNEHSTFKEENKHPLALVRRRSPLAHLRLPKGDLGDLPEYTVYSICSAAQCVESPCILPAPRSYNTHLCVDLDPIVLPDVY